MHRPGSILKRVWRCIGSQAISLGSAQYYLILAPTSGSLLALPDLDNRR
jgi:hypothetical protein